jgi:formamidopyrimidine-DNA glycosylase
VPELPEVETIVREVAPRLVGRRIRRAHLAKSDVLRRVSRKRLLAALTGNTVIAATRRAKHAVFQLKSGQRMVIQPRMTGSLIVHEPGWSDEDSGYAVLTCTLTGGDVFVYRDVRRLGTVWLLDDRGWAAYTARIGPEPLQPEFTPAVFAAALARTRVAVKKAIMDQRLLAGVGNIYANEALFDAAIDPSRSARSLSRAESDVLHGTIVDVLQRALKASGTTIRDYRTGTGERGRFQFELKVYDRGGEPCRRCGRRLVTTHAIDLRQTTLCAFCQR